MNGWTVLAIQELQQENGAVPMMSNAAKETFFRNHLSKTYGPLMDLDDLKHLASEEADAVPTDLSEQASHPPHQEREEVFIPDHRCRRIHYVRL